ncbi:nitroreductase family protein [Albidovulum sp.]|uniref:nitroreductase family protein n=1 Tax=Albidovulum sp. TaxID=1872424 RepID=UPI003D7EF460
MPDPNHAAMEFLLTRRSRPPRTLTTPVPTRAELLPILTAGARVPDHGKLEPWRFIVLERPALQRLAQAARERGAELAMDPERIAKGVAQFADAHLAIVVIKVPRDTAKVPEIEQTLSAGAACLSLVNAALASGWGAAWLTGWHVHDPEFATRALGLAPGEWVAGVIHVGTETSAPPDRPRPDLDGVTTWVTA